MANTTLTGWSRGTWGEAAWNRHAPVLVTQSAATSALGSVVVVPSIEVPVTQSTATGAVGTVVVVPSIEVNVTQSAATGAVGSVTIVGTSVLSLTGTSATSSVGNSVVDYRCNSYCNRCICNRFYRRRKCLGINSSRSNS